MVLAPIAPDALEGAYRPLWRVPLRPHSFDSYACMYACNICMHVMYACYVCMYVTLCIYIYIYIHNHIYMHTYACIHTYICIHTCTHACIRSVLDVLERFGSTRFAGLAIKVYSRDGCLHWSMQHYISFYIYMYIYIYIYMQVLRTQSTERMHICSGSHTHHSVIPH